MSIHARLVSLAIAGNVSYDLGDSASDDAIKTLSKLHLANKKRCAQPGVVPMDFKPIIDTNGRVNYNGNMGNFNG